MKQEYKTNNNFNAKAIRLARPAVNIVFREKHELAPEYYQHCDSQAAEQPRHT